MAPQNHLKFDLENGDPEKEGRRSTAVGGEGGSGFPQSNDEYSNLVRYISTYRDGRRKSTISLGSGQNLDDDKKVAAWKFWKRKASKPKTQKGAIKEAFQAPEDWMNTDMKQGLSDAEVETRRKAAGWNELTTEKENPFLKFLGYFQGPILYGEHIFEVRSTY